jgi:hemerythrin superfamily protein
MDAITLLKNDHRTVEKLFKKFEKTGDDAAAAKREVVDAIIEELSVHTAIEEQVFYPAVREALPDLDDIVLEGLEEHHVSKWTLAELADMSPEHERFDAKVTVLIESVRHHLKEEEEDLFPDVRKALGRKALGQIGDAMEEARRTAPTTPRPTLPDTPPGNLTAGAAAAASRKARRAATEKRPAKKRT